MTSRHERIKEIFEEICDAPQSERSDILDRMCGTEEHDLRREIESLLRHVDTPGLDLDDATSQIGRMWDSVRETIVADDPVGERIGDCTIERVLGAGGMGVVYLARQDHTNREVAVKVVRSGLSHADALRRFAWETEVLGRLQHPGIARLYEAGVSETDQGRRPFFVMEYVDGRPLLSAIDDLDRRARLELMIRICDAVNHAHQRGVIHRDLKPGNIMIDEAGEVKILDFGIARASDAEHYGATRHTMDGQVVGTLAYMSPEQAGGDTDDLDIRSDVYTIGVVLYEMLCGRRPYDVPDRPLPDAIRVIREVAPRPLRSHDGSIAGDVETIVGKTLEKDRTRRYDSAAALGRDLRRFLDDQPIAARPPSAVYQVRMFARRHTALVTAAIAVVLALAVGATGLTAGLLNARNQTRIANKALAAKATEQARAEAINDFLNDDVLGRADPFRESNADLTIREALDMASSAIGELSDPIVEAGVRGTIGRAYENLGLFVAAEEHFRRADTILRDHPDADPHEQATASADVGRIEWRQSRFEDARRTLADARVRATETLGKDDKLTLDIIGLLGVVEYDLSDYESAETTLLDTLARLIAVGAADSPEAASAAHNLGLVYRETGRYEEAVEMLLRSRDIERILHPDGHPDISTTERGLAGVYRMQGRFDEADVLMRKVCADLEARLGPDHTSTLGAMNDLVEMYRILGRGEEAEPIMRRVVETQLEKHGERHRPTLNAMTNYARILGDLGRHDEAIPYAERSVRIGTEMLGETSPYTVSYLGNYAILLRQVDRLAEAEEIFLRLARVQYDQFGSGSLKTLAVEINLADLILLQDRAEDAAERLARIVADAKAANPGGHWTIGALLGRYGDALARLDRHDESEAALLEAHDILMQTFDEDHGHNQTVIKLLAELYETQGRSDDAMSWQARLIPE